jgi:hypothetical protein
MTPKGADLEATDLIEVSTLESGSYVTRSITGQELIDAIPLPPSGLTVGTTPIASGTVGRVLFQGTGNVLQQSSSLFWDSTNNRLGIGTSTPSDTLDVNGNAKIGNGTDSILKANSLSSLNFNTIRLEPNTTNNSLQLDIRPNGSSIDLTGIYLRDSSTGGTGSNLTLFGRGQATLPSGGVTYFGAIVAGAVFANSMDLGFLVSNTSLGRFEAMRIFKSGNIGVNTTTDAGFKLDVNGTARVQGTTTISKSGSTNYFTFEPSATGTAPFISAFFAGAVDARMYFDSGALKLRVAGTSILYGLDCGNILANGNIQLNGGTEHKLHLAGSTNNYIQYTDAGAINIGVIGTADATSYIQVRTGNATNMSTGTMSTAFFNTGNVGINTTTDAGFKLDVNGTARVQGNSFEVTNGTNKIAITSTQISCLAGVSVSDLNIVAGPISAPNSILGIGTTVSGGSTTILRLGAGNATNASGIVTIIESPRGFAPTSGTATFSFATWNGTINQTGGANGITRGLYINPTLTSAADFRAIETTAGRVVFGNLPTSSAGLPTGAIWNDGGTLKIV